MVLILENITQLMGLSEIVSGRFCNSDKKGIGFTLEYIKTKNGFSFGEYGDPRSVIESTIQDLDDKLPNDCMSARFFFI